MPMPATPEVSTQDPVTQAQLRQLRQQPPHMPVTVPTLSDIEATARRTVDHDAGLPSRMQTKTPPSPHTNHSCSPRSAESLTGAQRVGFNQKVEQETCAHWPDLQIDRKGIRMCCVYACFKGLRHQSIFGSVQPCQDLTSPAIPPRRAAAGGTAVAAGSAILVCSLLSELEANAELVIAAGSVSW
jgi:hypothetical protein